MTDLLISTLNNAGSKQVYGLLGDSLNGITDAMRRDGAIAWMQIHHREAAAFAVCAGSFGPDDLVNHQRTNDVMTNATAAALAGSRAIQAERDAVDHHQQFPALRHNPGGRVREVPLVLDGRHRAEPRTRIWRKTG